ncbi:protein SAWADEE HOMEODOMAIN HOMOLOG 2-like [Mercurialis annua]|uniref:protein SAWADEE HOMEODOMAIN HOMOLOG 2-like n=1 Tax=Mercurialis annua TaxID=3986 RepID=UPI00215FEAC6|nr:protein SAWADEE HOMEODOMAIN HOMOLOG 2-like [Mercurialis annua]XP_055960753.1 protein SAWADEE HOMEODOMAIN HOMOLOG 2-like [Mercurialis annua]
MGRPPSNGGPTFRFMASEVTEMENILQVHNYGMPAKEVLVDIAEKFSESPDRKGKFTVQMKQVWNWFQNKRYAVRAKTSKTPVKLNVTPMSREESTPVRNVPQPIAASIPASIPAPITAAVTTPSVPNAGRANTENSCMEFEAKSARDGAWYDVGTFLSHRHVDTGDPEVLVRFSGFGPDEDEWINIRKHVRQRSLPCEASECVAVLPGDLILCFQEGKDQALYFDAHVLDAQRRRHDVRGCRCRFLVRYDHDQSEEIVPLRKVCRRPETDYRLQQLHAANESAAAEQQKSNTDPSTASIQRIFVSAPEKMRKLQNADISAAGSIPNANPSETKIAETSNIVNIGNSPTVLASGTVNIGNSPTTVNIGNSSSVLASGTVNIGNPPNVLTSGTVNIGNPPSISASGTVNIGNPPSVLASGTVNIGNPPSVLASCTVNIGNPPSVAASSTVNAESSGVAPISISGGSVESLQGGKS